MSENNNNHEPVLMPKDKAKTSKPRVESRANEPILMSENHRAKKVKPPYLLIFLVFLGLVSVFWKMVFYGDKITEQKPVESSYYNKKNIK